MLYARGCSGGLSVAEMKDMMLELELDQLCGAQRADIAEPAAPLRAVRGERVPHQGGRALRYELETQRLRPVSACIARSQPRPGAAAQPQPYAPRLQPYAPKLHSLMHPGCSPMHPSCSPVRPSCHPACPVRCRWRCSAAVRPT